MSKLSLLMAVLLATALGLLPAGGGASAAELFGEEEAPPAERPQPERNLEYALRRGLWLPAQLGEALDSRERRSAAGMGSSFIRFGRAEAVSQPQTRSDLIIRYGRDGLNGRLTKLRQERMRRLARLALICAAKSQDDAPANSAEEKILREICKDAPLHPTVPDFV
ncbi:uncharacterized protein LOC131673146 [Phymastichus coffea]|uniref:uncharacterized protein LOC131673146 n=1 Tax=Phymastichus coffea TaxID=108790 RepID=UPI00273B8F5C|nr:uncharacterized protein LOC131673146 [Phymastichus coffea]